jgi:hypothetical protein
LQCSQEKPQRERHATAASEHNRLKEIQRLKETIANALSFPGQGSHILHDTLSNGSE